MCYKLLMVLDVDYDLDNESMFGCVKESKELEMERVRDGK